MDKSNIIIVPQLSDIHFAELLQYVRRHTMEGT